MTKKTIGLIPAFAMLAAVALAQNADRNTAGPTRNDLRLRVSEPAEGATLSGGSVRVVVDYNRAIFGEGQGTHFGDTTFPPAKFSVFLDGKLQETLTAGENNVATIENIAPGRHKIVVEAANISGEVIDRKEVNFSAASEAMAPPATSAPAATYSAPSPTRENPASSVAPTPAELPQTASSAPSLAAMGLLLAFSGLLLLRQNG